VPLSDKRWIVAACRVAPNGARRYASALTALLAALAERTRDSEWVSYLNLCANLISSER
jgi:hypothetical protein